MQMIALKKLELSDANVRKSINAEADAELKAGIEARGVLQNLLVTRGAKRGTFGVIAGGRRFRMLKELQADGKIDGDYEVPCKLCHKKDGDASEISAQENIQRLAMTPAEECQAFLHFLGDDGDVEGVAKRFGMTKRHVEGRLRLARLAPPVFEALEKGEITLDRAKAYAATDRHEVQIRVFEQTKYNSYIGADGIRRMIGEGSIRGNDPIALLVGEDDYTAAGGKVERDLFSDDADDRWLDIDVAHELAGQKMQAEAERLANEHGIGWIKPVAGSSSYSVRDDLDVSRVMLPPAPITEEAQARIEAINTRLDEVYGIFEEGDFPEGQDEDTLNEECEALEAEQRELENPERELPEEWKPEVGRFLVLSHEGEMVLENDYYSEKSLTFEEDEDGNVVGGETINTTSGGTTRTAPPEATGPGGKPYSARLFDELAVQRRNVLAAYMVGDPALALDFTIFALVDASYTSKGTTLKGGKAHDRATGEVLQSEADNVLAQAFDALDSSWTEPSDVCDRFVAFRNLDDDAKVAWVAYAAATSLECGYGSYNPLHNLMGQMLDIDASTLWRPTSENFFDRVPKATCLASLAEIGGDELVARYASSKKADLSSSCEKVFAGEAIIEEDLKERALSWVPSAMLFAFAADEDPEEVDDADDEGSTNPDEGDDAGDGNDGDTNVNDAAEDEKQEEEPAAA